MADFSDLITDIAGLDEYPIRVGYIVDWLKENNFQDIINFFPVDIDPSKATAYFKRYSDIAPPYADKPWVCDIVYSQHLNECWRRFLCCKELLHFFDTVEQRADSKDDVGVLIQQLTSYSNFGQIQGAPSPFTEADNEGYRRALVALAPLKAIEALRPAYEGGEIGSYRIALFLKIPETYVGYLFSEEYAAIYTSYKHNHLCVEKAA